MIWNIDSSWIEYSKIEDVFEDVINFFPPTRNNISQKFSQFTFDCRKELLQRKLTYKENQFLFIFSSSSPSIDETRIRFVRKKWWKNPFVLKSVSLSDWLWQRKLLVFWCLCCNFCFMQKWHFLLPKLFSQCTFFIKTLIIFSTFNKVVVVLGTQTHIY